MGGRSNLRAWLSSLALGLALMAGCAQGGGGDAGMVRPDAPDRDAATDDGGAPDSGPPPIGPVRSTHGGVASGHVSRSARYRLVLSTSSGGASPTPSSSRYVLREHAIGRIAQP